MVNLGTTSDIIVTIMLALSQLIEPVPETAIQAAEKRIAERNSCQVLEQKKSEYESRKCERIKEVRAKYKVTCQGLENDIGVAETQCATDPGLPALLRFRPKPLVEVMKLDNAHLVTELNMICSSLQDRAFLEREQWMNGEIASRDDLASKLIVLMKPELQEMASKVLKESADGDFITADAYKVVTALCHWKVDRKALAEQVDFTSAYKYLQAILDEIPNVEELPELPQASFVYDSKNQRIGEIFDKEFIDRAGKKYLGQVHRRRLVAPTQIPRQMYNAFTAIEDKRFRQHNGFDFEAIKRLYYGGTSGSKQGGSTFTIQLVKNAFFDKDVEAERAVGLRTLRRKIKELLMIPMVEARYSKDEILAYYLNLIDLTPDAQGVMMTSMDLFGKDDLSQLDLSEIALLAALPKGVSKYNPYRNPKEAKLRRDTVLKVMAEQGYISEAEKTEAQSKELKLVPKTGADRKRIMSRYFTGHITNYFAELKKEHARDPRWTLGGFDIKTPYDAVLQENLTTALDRGLIRYEATTSRPGSGGPRLKWKPWIDETTGQNMNIEKMLKDADGESVSLSEIFFSLKSAHPYPETGWLMAAKLPKESSWLLENGQHIAVNGDDLRIFKSLKAYDLVLLAKLSDEQYMLGMVPSVQGAGVVLDIETGDVLALTGGFSSGAYGKFAQNNRATGSSSKGRQPGSTIKPLVYLYALNHGASPTQILSNLPVRFPKVKNCPYKWSPKNYEKNGSSQMSVRTALQNSENRSLINLFVNISGISTNMNSGTDLSEISNGDKYKLTSNLDNIYDLAAHFGAYPPRDELKTRGLAEPCFPFLLGGYETTPLNMAQAYAAIANGGLKRDAIFLKEVLKDGDPILIDRSLQRWSELHDYRASLKYGFSRAPEAFDAISEVNPIAVAQVRYMMQGILANGTATSISRWSHLMGGKTGTTNSSRDAWFAGFTNKIAIVIWVGYDDTSVYSNLGEKRTGANVALPIAEDFMESYFKLYPDRLHDPLPLPSEIPGVFRVKVDPESGQIYKPAANGVCNFPVSAIDEYFPDTPGNTVKPNSCN